MSSPSSQAAEPQAAALNWRSIGIIVGALALLWALGVGVIPYWGYIPLIVVAILTAVVAGFAIYIWRLVSKQKGIATLLSQAAASPEGRVAALQKLQSGDAKDAMNALAQAQLIAQDDPAKAIDILEKVDLPKAPGAIQDQVRSTLALLYLGLGRSNSARPIVDAMKLDNAGDPKSRAMFAAVMAETYARSSSPEEARKLIETFSADDPAFGEVRPLLLRAQVFTFFATKNRGLARQAMDKMVEIDPNLLAPFLQPKMSPELQKIARDALEAGGYMTRQRVSQRYRP